MIICFSPDLSRTTLVISVNAPGSPVLPLRTRTVADQLRDGGGDLVNLSSVAG